MATVKRGRDRLRPQGHRDGLNRDSMMSMDREDTRTAYESREIADEDETAYQRRIRKNREALAQAQSRMKPIRSGQS